MIVQEVYWFSTFLLIKVMLHTIKPKLNLVQEECLANNVGNNLDGNFSSLKKYILM